MLMLSVCPFSTSSAITLRLPSDPLPQGVQGSLGHEYVHCQGRKVGIGLKYCPPVVGEIEVRVDVLTNHVTAKRYPYRVRNAESVNAHQMDYQRLCISAIDSQIRNLLTFCFRTLLSIITSRRATIELTMGKLTILKYRKKLGQGDGSDSKSRG